MRTSTELRLVNSRRHCFEVVRDILMVAHDGANATRIVYGANLTFTRFKKYSDCLVAKELLAVYRHHGTNYRGIYRTTEKGKRLLEILTEAIKLI